MTDSQIQALVRAHWNEFMGEEMVIAQGIAGLEREADENGQLQLAMHKLECAKLEVACYSHAISKIVRTMSSRSARRHATGRESGFPIMNLILISHQARVVILLIPNQTCPPPPKV